MIKKESIKTFEEIKKLVLNHIQSLLLDAGDIEKAGGYPVGTIRTWKGQRFIKIAPDKWRRKYDKETRGARQALLYLKKQIEAANTPEEMMNLILQNRDRFSDENDNPLPFVQELSKLIQSKQSVSNEAGKALEKDAIETFSILSDVLNGKSEVVNNPDIGDVLIDAGITGKGGWGIKHIIEQRAFKDGKNTEEITAMIPLIIDSVMTGDVIRDVKIEQKGNDIGTLTIEKNGIIAFVGKSKYGSGDKFVITGYDNLNKKEEATDAIQAVIAKYNYTPEFVIVKKQVGAVIASLSKVSNKQKEKSSNIKDKYQSFHSTDGYDDEIYVGKESIQGKWKLVEAEAPSASHDEITFSKTEGFPTNEDGSTINDRDYEKDKAAQEAVIDIAGDFDGRALSFDSPVVVTTDGIVVSGNNRTMSSKLAARKGSDKKYLAALDKRAKRFGFNSEDLAAFKNPRVIFEIEADSYNTGQFAKFNQSGKKAMNPVESAVKVAKTIKVETIEDVAGKISEYETLGELYANNKAMEGVFNSFIHGGIIQKIELPAYFTESGVTGAGKEFMETVLIGSIIDESNIRQLSTDGAKSIRQKLVRAITPLIENKSMDGYSINKELNEAVRIAVEVSKNKKDFPGVEEYSKQQNMFEKMDPVALEIAKKLEGTQKSVAEFFQGINSGLKPSANGEIDIFIGDVESKDEILQRYLNIKKSVHSLLMAVLERSA